MTLNYEKKLTNGALVKIEFENELYKEPNIYINNLQFGTWDFIELWQAIDFLKVEFDSITLNLVKLTKDNVEEIYKFITSCEDQYDKEVEAEESTD